MKLWLDDRRGLPDGYDLLAKTADECIGLMQRHGASILHVSLDHDLATEHYSAGSSSGYFPAPPLDRSRFREKTGYAVVEWMVQNSFWPQDVNVHSLSEQGTEDMLALLRKHAPPTTTVTRRKSFEFYGQVHRT